MHQFLKFNFGRKFYMFRTVPLSIVGSFSPYTQQCYMSYGWQLSAKLYDIYHSCMYSEKKPDDGQRNYPKHVEFYSKNKFEKLVHLVGFILRIFWRCYSKLRTVTWRRHDQRAEQFKLQWRIITYYWRHQSISVVLTLAFNTHFDNIHE